MIVPKQMRSSSPVAPNPLGLWNVWASMQRQSQDRSFWTSHDRIHNGIAAVMTRIFISRRVPAIAFPAGWEFTVKTEMLYRTTAIGNSRGRLDLLF